MKARAFQMAFLYCALATSSVLGQADVEFAKANQEYTQGHFKEATSGYETLVRAGQWSANVFYDLSFLFSSVSFHPSPIACDAHLAACDASNLCRRDCCDLAT